MMKARRWLSPLLLLFSGLISIWYGSAYALNASGSPDFRAVYYGTRCLIQHHNPYNEGELESVYRAEGGERPSDSLRQRQVVTSYVNLPTTFLFIAPLALLPWRVAQALWLALIAGLFILAAYLMWRLGRNYAPGVSFFLVCVVIVNSEVVFAGGNTAGIVVGLCVVAVWCFLQERFVPAGILCMSVSLAIKPHDSGLVWLYFLLAGGVYRKRALQTLVLTAAMALPAILWVSQVAPSWMRDWNSNMASFNASGGLNDPGIVSSKSRNVDMIINLQTVVSVFRDIPRIYNSVSYLACGALLLVWTFATLRSRFSKVRAWLALAAIVPLTMLITYHRPWDAKLLLLTVPACAILWAEGGLIGWLALLINSVGIISTGDIPLVILSILSRNLHTSTATFFGRVQTAVFTRPIPLILLVMSIFYLFVYVRRGDPETSRWIEWRVTQKHDSDVAESEVGAK